MKPTVIIDYLRVNGHWSWKAVVGKVTASGDIYPGTKKGLREMKRDASDAIKHLRDKGNVKVKRNKKPITHASNH